MLLSCMVLFDFMEKLVGLSLFFGWNFVIEVSLPIECG
jgi:hypothetical protein